MDLFLNNSFYYFFSATPQVLAGMLALFGVFVIFKIQTIRTHLLGIGQAVINKATNTHIFPENIMEAGTAQESLSALELLINKENLDEIKTFLESIQNESYLVFRDTYNRSYAFLGSLIRVTLILSIFTGSTIIFTLSVIPFGKFFLNHYCLMYTLFGLTILCVGICFSGLIVILKISLNSKLTFKKYLFF
jgi:hypothetical protein